ncbi:MAG: hypothetical protein KAS12_01375 [Candidatus Aenigmarchaeota archaeon]|nr:hypothetical protein [Candidatus Aenigmarchaeota archaeon]
MASQEVNLNPSPKEENEAILEMIYDEMRAKKMDYKNQNTNDLLKLCMIENKLTIIEYEREKLLSDYKKILEVHTGGISPELKEIKAKLLVKESESRRLIQTQGDYMSELGENYDFYLSEKELLNDEIIRIKTEL